MALRLNHLFCFKVLLIVTGVFGLSQNALAHGEPCNPFMPKPCGDGEACLLKTVSPTYEGITYACHVMNIDYEVVDPEQDPEGIPLLLTFAMIPSPKKAKADNSFGFNQRGLAIDPPRSGTLRSPTGWLNHIKNLDIIKNKPKHKLEKKSEELLKRFIPFWDEDAEQKEIVEVLATTLEAIYATSQQAKGVSERPNKLRRWVLLEFAMRAAFKDLVYQGGGEPLEAAKQFLKTTQEVRGSTEVMHDENMIALTLRMGQSPDEIRARSVMSLVFTGGSMVAAATVAGSATAASGGNIVVGYLAGKATAAACTALHSGVKVATGDATAKEAAAGAAKGIVLGAIPVVGLARTVESVGEDVCGVGAGEKLEFVESVKTGKASPLLEKGVKTVKVGVTKVQELLRRGGGEGQAAAGGGKVPDSPKGGSVDRRLSRIYTVFLDGEWLNDPSARLIFF